MTALLAPPAKTRYAIPAQDSMCNLEMIYGRNLWGTILAGWLCNWSA